MCLYPFFPEKMSEMFHKLGLTDYETRLENGELHTLRSETPVFEIKEKGEPLFMRIEVEK
ncbi:MAG: hypothetical protein H6767_02675 [Candidatus Peribacteria bacterium]|nr:MAG: hypothetical protein H6767_02675 [Candidatus Peribacteria bacterium]